MADEATVIEEKLTSLAPGPRDIWWTERPDTPLKGTPPPPPPPPTAEELKDMELQSLREENADLRAQLGAAAPAPRSRKGAATPTLTDEVKPA
jgi:hypothetical protein